MLIPAAVPQTCLSLHVQLVHPAQQGKYALCFEPDVQQVEMAGSNGSWAVMTALGCAQSGEGYSVICFNFGDWCISRRVFLHSELIQPSATSVN